MNVKRLDGRQLNHWVAKSAGLTLSLDYQKPGTRHDPESGVWHPHTYNPANDWSQAGPIVSGEWFAIEDALMNWFGPQWPHIPAITENPLKWFMRAYVSTQFGDEVEDTGPFSEIQGTVATVAAAAGQAQQHNWLIPRWLR
jgi:hypothetical protein